jgi:Tfp pilus assembly protein PilN
MFLLKEINAQKNKNQILTLKLKQCEQKKKGFEIEKQGQIKTENVLQMLNVLIKEQVQNAKMLSELSAIIPDAITLTNINKNGNEIIIIGNSIAMQNIADLLKNSTNNNFFKNPDLAEIKNSGKNEHLFVIKLELK